MSIFRRQKTLAELQEENEVLDTQLSVAQKRAMINRLEAQMGKGSWRLFSDNGSKSGINFSRIWHWLKSH